ncbi:MAG TPA: hypothetical protein VFV39_04370 [Limnobacter sp.]|nr:hypothetical protein [Limnobacter sp.]
MNFKKIAVAAAIATGFAMPLSAQASDIATLNGWGALFAAAHAGQQQAAAQGQGEIKVGLFQARQQPPAAQPAPAAPETQQPAPASPAPQTGDEGMAEAPAMDAPEGDMANADNATAESAEAGQAQMGKATASANASLSASVKLTGDGVGKALDAVDGVYQTAGTVVEGVVGGVMGTAQTMADRSSGLNVAADAAQSGSLNVAGLATANVASTLSTTASIASAGQLSAITAMTSSLVQNVIAARPASLSGLLR